MRRAKPFVELPEETMRRQLAKLVEERILPSLEQLSAAVLETRMKYAGKIRRARREAQRKIAIN